MISQSTFFIPPELEAGLLSGDLHKFGGIVRDSAGHIVKHLDEIDLPVDGEKVAAAAAKALKDPRVVIGAVAVGAVVAGTAAVVAAKKRRRLSPECVANYNACLAAYLEAVHDGRLDEDIIARLIEALDAVMSYSDEAGSIALDFSTKQAALLVQLVVDSTKQLAKDNALDLGELGVSESDSDGNVIDLRRYLEVQRRIFSATA